MRFVHQPRSGPQRSCALVETMEPRRLLTAVETLESRTLLSTFTVTNALDSGPGSLRQAILDANSHAAADRIDFNIPGAGTHTITLHSALPTISDPVTIAGSTQGGYSTKPLIELRAAGNVPNTVVGLNVTAGHSVIKALALSFFGTAIKLSGQGYNAITACFIGTNLDGTAAAGGTKVGILIEDSSNNIIGGAGPAVAGQPKGDLISGNSDYGIVIRVTNSSNGSGATGNLIAMNKIGTDFAGHAAIPNGTGIALDTADGNTIGGADSGNVISGNSGAGIMVYDGSGNTIQSNFIGTTASGTVALGNGAWGIYLSQGDGNLIGGPELGNVISGNGKGGLDIEPPCSTRVQGNRIGTDTTGVKALGNVGSGIEINSMSGSTIGGTAADDRNIISGNQGDGVQVVPKYVFAGNTTNIQNNYIGTDVSGKLRLGNTQDGVEVVPADGNIVVGGPGGAGNVIAFNHRNGVTIGTDTSAGSGLPGTAIVYNSIHDNGKLGIDLGNDGVTPNRAGPLHFGLLPNNDQSFPVITSTAATVAIVHSLPVLRTLVKGTLSGGAGTTYKVQLFASAKPNASGYGEGATYLGQVNVTPAGSSSSVWGSASFSCLVPRVTGQWITATATDPNNNTSEFSKAFEEILSGTVFNDPNKNGKQDSGDAGLAGWKVYDDVNNVGYFVSGDPFTFTNASGAYSLSVPATGTAHLRQMIPANWSQTGPAGNAAISVVLNGTGKSGLNFGDVSSIKYLSTVATMPGIVAWWTFDVQSQANSILNGYTGTLNGGATVANVGPPLVGEASSYALSLNGSSAFVNTNLTTQQEFTTAATVNVWVNLGNTPAKSGHIYTIAAKSQFGNDLDLQVETDGKVHFYTDSGSSASFTPTSLTGWHMVTAEFDTAAKVRNIFWDGQLVASTNPYTGVHSASTQAFSIGASDVFAGRFFDGNIDEVSLWNRPLSAAEVAAIYAASK